MSVCAGFFGVFTSVGGGIDLECEWDGLDAGITGLGGLETSVDSDSSAAHISHAVSSG